MTKPRSVPLLLILVSACQAGFLGRTERAIGTAMTATNLARDEFLRWDALHQTGLLERVGNRKAAELALDGYRKAREPVLLAFGTAYAALAAALAALPLVDAGVMTPVELVERLQTVALSVDNAGKAARALAASGP